MMASGLYCGKVYHGRHQPFSHKFTYKVFSLVLDLDELPHFSEKLSGFSFNKWNMVSVWNKDHGPRDGSELRPWIEQHAKAKNIDLSGGKIFLLTFPRLWGYVFNPISLYFCHDKTGQLVAILHQVKNTFGEQHGYLLPVEKAYSGTGNIRQDCPKTFYVSPFIQMDCHYNFRVQPPDQESFNVAIHQTTPDGKILTATWDGSFQELTARSLRSAILRHPLMTLKVILGIHWEAFHLWRKGATYFRRPKKLTPDVT